MGETTDQAILDAIPHRKPFLFVDKIIEWTDERILTEYTFVPGEFFFPGHYPASPIVPGVILCESAMQAGAVFLSKLFALEAEKAHEPIGAKMPVVGRMGEVRFKRIVRPGETIQCEVQFKEKMTNVYFLTAKVAVSGSVAVRFEFACTRTASALREQEQ